MSASIVDNDIDCSAKIVVDSFLRSHDFRITYSVAQERNLALARNLSVDNSTGDYVAFIDDDEYPQRDWLLLLYLTLNRYKVSGVFGPVVPEYEALPPRWIVQGRLCDRERPKTGTVLDWRQTRTGNALLRREIFKNDSNRFDLTFRAGGEDDTLFKELLRKGYTFVWCDEAEVYEAVPASRLTYSYFKRRNLLIGFINYRYLRYERSATENVLFLVKSISALAIYPVLGPLGLALGYQHWMSLRFRYFYHKGVVLTFLGFLNYQQRDL
jgi:glycosyltransferase involved in cell wall biosynthesis